MTQNNIQNIISSSFHKEIIQYELTTHAAWTASDTQPALGSHQNTWHWKCWFPVSMMKANVCTSRPTPMKDKNRTRHSTNTSSSSSCTAKRRIRALLDPPLYNRCGTLASFIYLLVLRIATKSPLPFLWSQPQWCQQYSVWQESSPLCLWRTGGCLWPHLWCPYLRTKHRCLNNETVCVGIYWRKQHALWCVCGFQHGLSFTYRSRHRCHTQIQHMKLLYQLSLWHGKLCSEKKHTETHIRTNAHTNCPEGNFITRQHLTQSSKGVHTW